MAVVNAGMGAVVTGHFNAQAGIGRWPSPISPTNWENRHSGAMAAKIMRKVLADAETVLTDCYISPSRAIFDPALAPGGQGASVRQHPNFLSRTGYTGEFGFEIFISSENIVKIWEMIHSAGQEFELYPVALPPGIPCAPERCCPFPIRISGTGHLSTIPGPLPCRSTTNRADFTKNFIGRSGTVGH